MLTIRPYPASRIAGASARIMWNAPVRLTERTESHSSSLMLTALRSRVIPALLTSRETPGGSAATAFATLAESAMSAWWNEYGAASSPFPGATSKTCTRTP